SQSGMCACSSQGKRNSECALALLNSDSPSSPLRAVPKYNVRLKWISGYTAQAQSQKKPPLPRKRRTEPSTSSTRAGSGASRSSQRLGRSDNSRGNGLENDEKLRIVPLGLPRSRAKLNTDSVLAGIIEVLPASRCS